ncbi:hypothetical protein HMPREF1981_01936 [Bacteroides pyogenes F0041]|uniref:Uncharacterized protein n=1 Tax=Bacteroides pyogenes F0041 TaxID=1321819 RepID=U2C462_9BACE|nr:hypothetical protein HMPREF1981_01936 [Bacteroides pyogenes F0041]
MAVRNSFRGNKDTQYFPIFVPALAIIISNRYLYTPKNMENKETI